MKIGLASDHRGYQLKEFLKEKLQEEGYQIDDYGTNSTESCDYPDFAFKLGKNVAKKNDTFGVAICGSGIGISIACNKVKGIRCAKVESAEEAVITRTDNDSNIIAFSEKILPETATEIVKNFIETPCSTLEKHQRRIAKIKKYEEEN